MRKSKLLFLFFVLMQGILIAQTNATIKDSLVREYRNRWFFSFETGSNFYAFPYQEAHQDAAIKQVPQIALGMLIKYKLTKRPISFCSFYFTAGVFYDNIQHKNVTHKIYFYSGFPQQPVEYRFEETYKYSFISIPIFLKLSFLKKKFCPFIYSGVQLENMLSNSQSFHRTFKDEAFPVNNYDTSGVIKNYYSMKAFNPAFFYGGGVRYTMNQRYSLLLDIRRVASEYRPLYHGPVFSEDALGYLGTSIGIEIKLQKTKNK